MIQFDEHIFQMGWFNHQADKVLQKLPLLKGENGWRKAKWLMGDQSTVTEWQLLKQKSHLKHAFVFPWQEVRNVEILVAADDVSPKHNTQLVWYWCWLRAACSGPKKTPCKDVR